MENEEIKKIYDKILKQVDQHEKDKDFFKKEQDVWKYILIGLTFGAATLEICNGYFPDKILTILIKIYNSALLPLAVAVSNIRSPSQKEEANKKYLSAKKIILNEITGECLKPKEKQEPVEDFYKKIKNMCQVSDELDC